MNRIDDRFRQLAEKRAAEISSISEEELIRAAQVQIAYALEVRWRPQITTDILLLALYKQNQRIIEQLEDLEIEIGRTQKKGT